MDTVYKYCGKYGLEVLRNLELLVRPPNQFNDPFEFTPKIICSDPISYATRILSLESTIKRLYDFLYQEGKFRGNFLEFQEWSKKEMRKLVAILAEAPQITGPLSEKDFLGAVSKLFGVLCVSGRRDSILMWGHYCDKPLGLVIGFDKSAPIFQQGKGLKRVDYVNERVVFDSCWEIQSSDMENYNHKIIFSKSDVWSYEQELRQFFWLSSLKPKALDDGTQGHFLSFPAEAIVSVTLGPRCSPDLENEAREILQKPCFSHMKRFDRATLHQNNFSMDFESV